ncbi:hypothetical protein FPANT_439 [Fusarium pseudoanthophilum]|uniref:Uncharacterized protein n=1 Tax=Fusarium pseudoanthophilum TaxID=48495 RepID=A0A8H5Q2X6_9HYPO|nr:hypothetical protein FPANT_439 [Fusarium pseudoanthophilum]
MASKIFEPSLGPIVRLASKWWIGSSTRRLEQQISVLNTALRENRSENESLDIVATVKDGDDRVLIKDLTAQDIDDMNDDPQLKKDYLRDVSLMKERLSIASRATELYNELSDKLIVPAIDWVGGLSTLNMSNESYGEMELEIKAKRLELSEGAKKLIMKRVAEIGIELKADYPQANVTELTEDISEEF